MNSLLLHDSKRVSDCFRGLELPDSVRNAGERGMGTNSGQPRLPRVLPSCLSRFGRAAGGRAAFHSQEWVCYGSLWACNHPRVCNRPRRYRSRPLPNQAGSHAVCRQRGTGILPAVDRASRPRAKVAQALLPVPRLHGQDLSR